MVQDDIWNYSTFSYVTTENSIWLCKQALQVALVVKNLPANAGDIRDVGLIPVGYDWINLAHMYALICKHTFKYTWIVQISV